MMDMYDSYLIEVAGRPAGIVARDGQRYRFHAAARPFHGLEGQIFADPVAAQRAAQRFLSSKGRRGGAQRQD
ncbi:hypothetical protein ACFQU1_03770 [Chelatococcus sp. GCM10030263]|uniref:hypothetical protein n=1 Tax=Chelatococcus sp. GCM10030263 TaxID=3273387 RepID=UPI0036106BED